MEVSVRELKDHLSEYLRQAQTGTQIVITSHGKPISRLVGPPPLSTDPQADAIARLNAHPWVRPGTGGKVLGARTPIKTRPGERLSDILLERE
jgi:prevent-host-death family protein